VVAFLSTSLDNVGAMIALFAAHELRPRRVAAGYLGASWVVAAAAWGGSKLVELLPTPYLGLLGLIPLGLGVQRASALRRPGPELAGGVPTDGGALTAALVTLAQSATCRSSRTPRTGSIRACSRRSWPAPSSGARSRTGSPGAARSAGSCGGRCASRLRSC
jgi:hypothetical protein